MDILGEEEKNTVKHNISLKLEKQGGGKGIDTVIILIPERKIGF